MIIDSHHHFWRYHPVEYAWIDESMRAIRRDFLPADLKREIKAAGVDGVISVQARQNLAETEWLLELASQDDFLRGVVGWVPLARPKVRVHLERFSAYPKFKGVRHVVQGEPDGFMLAEPFNDGIRQLREFGLVYDILIVERQLPEAMQLVDRHPDQVFVLDHLAKPLIKHGAFEPWRKNLMSLARRPQVWSKLSGMVTEADFADWTPEQLFPYFETALEAFGPERLLFGSDWPVCLVACDYARWKSTVEQWLAPLSPDERAAILGGNAATAYRL
jgi:L-fuconolactonase